MVSRALLPNVLYRCMPSINSIVNYFALEWNLIYGAGVLFCICKNTTTFI